MTNIYLRCKFTKQMTGGVFREFPAFRKFLVLVGITCFSILIFSLISFLLANLVYGINAFSNPGLLSDISNPVIIKSLKLIQVISTGLGMFIIPAFAAAFLFDKNFLDFLSLKKKSPLFSYLIVLAISFSSIPIINLLVEWNSNLSLPTSFQSIESWMRNSEQEAEKITEAFLKVNSTSDLFLNIFIIAFLPALGEELFFRGLIQKFFSQMTKNIHAGIILTAVLFSAIHMQFFGFVPRMALGILLGYLLVWSGNLWLPVAAHFINNAGAVIFSYLEQQKIMGVNPDEIGIHEGETQLIIFSIIITGVLLFLLFRIENKKTGARFI